jgi:hypothetical protein
LAPATAPISLHSTVNASAWCDPQISYFGGTFIPIVGGVKSMSLTLIAVANRGNVIELTKKP